jgi:carbamate kinase
MSKKILVALGGNALGSTLEEQMQAVHQTGKAIAELVEQGYEIVITHGNGPQVGLVSDVFSCYEANHETSHFTLSLCVSLTQGLIGYDLQNAVREELLNRGLKKYVSTLITQVVVDKKDPAFNTPTKPIGPFYNKAIAKTMISKGVNMMEDSGRGHRRVVASPKPVRIVEKNTIKTLLNSGEIVIACGGGGIPVVKEGNHLRGVEAVIDKDFASARLAEVLEVDYFIILTAVEKVAINFGKENEQWLDELTCEQAKQYNADGQFGIGSMQPKVQACVEFIEKSPKSIALITHLEKVSDGLKGLTGTRIVK